MDEHGKRSWWRLEWLARVHELADRELQLLAWLNPNPRTWNPHYSFIEYATTYEDYANWPKRVEQGLISDEEAEIVAGLDDAIRGYQSPGGNDHDDEAILADPAWLSITMLAQTARSRLLLLLTDPEERSALTERDENDIEAMRQA